jgi:hypothetical protein
VRESSELGNAVLQQKRIEQYTPVYMPSESEKIGAVPEDMLAQSLFVAVSKFVEPG